MELLSLAQQGATFNVMYREYRPLHALIQESPHPASDASVAPPPGGGKLSVEKQKKLKALDRLLANGADPGLTGAWPPARAVIVAAFAGDHEIVARMRLVRPLSS